VTDSRHRKGHCPPRQIPQGVGSCEAHSLDVLGSAITLGLPPCAAKIAAHVASYGGLNWHTNAQIQQYIRRADGREYHAESIGRATRLLRERRLLHVARIAPGAPLPLVSKKQWVSGHGTTVKTLTEADWKRFGVRKPTAAERRRLAHPTKPEPRGARPRYAVFQPDREQQGRAACTSEHEGPIDTSCLSPELAAQLLAFRQNVERNQKRTRERVERAAAARSVPPSEASGTGPPE
jgi:hypothetical protein